MPITISKQPPLVAIHAQGRYSVADLRRGVQAALNGVPPDLPGLLMDLTRSESLRERTIHDVREMAAFLAGQAHRFSRRMAIAVSTEAAYGQMRQGSVFAEHHDLTVRVFRCRDQAVQWLMDESSPGPFQDSGRASAGAAHSA